MRSSRNVRSDTWNTQCTTCAALLRYHHVLTRLASVRDAGDALDEICWTLAPSFAPHKRCSLFLYDARAKQLNTSNVSSESLVLSGPSRRCRLVRLTAARCFAPAKPRGEQRASRFSGRPELPACRLLFSRKERVLTPYRLEVDWRLRAARRHHVLVTCSNLLNTVD